MTGLTNGSKNWSDIQSQLVLAVQVKQEHYMHIAMK